MTTVWLGARRGRGFGDPPPAPVYRPNPTQRGELQSHLRLRNLPDSVALRMRIVLLVDEGASYQEIAEKLDTTAPTISLMEAAVQRGTWWDWQPSTRTTAAKVDASVARQDSGQDVAETAGRLPWATCARAPSPRRADIVVTPTVIAAKMEILDTARSTA
jgi:hypothetical protein